MAALVYWMDMAGVIVFALSGVILACRTRMDPFGMLVLAAVASIGGGTIRDLVLGVRPVFWVTDPTYLWVVLATVALSILGFHYIHRLTRTFLPVTDACGLALFTVIGTHKALMLGNAGVVAVLMGMMTGVAGGMLRDVLARRVPMVLRQEIYATASILGGTAYVLLLELQMNTVLSIGLALGLTLSLRLAAIYWQLSLPTFAWVVTPPPEPADTPPRDTAVSDAPAHVRRRPKVRVKLISPRTTRRRR
ncbi:MULTISPECIES: trimeric intracellular cation channel family protein [Halomonadaceae]|uniref:trimeric intracellular cation channel family protein n=1 Tax=Halomonadaceae TaxID=28256 RepID=UPI0015835E09|nr:trimeric intracellular cation channel family protein [Halomonas sp. BMC7]MDI4638661.1 trimeric intracellular cation channel family protein [Halomonas sp. BMC7]NUJ59647.1 trimeric intracellular cation channel family protein [Halomonas taeanensis]